MSPRRTLPLLVAAAVAMPGPGQEATEHPGRRERDTPGLVLETGARTAEIDVLQFTTDGKHLLAAGDDKAVRTWAVTPDGKLRTDDLPALRWPVFRDDLGNIYTMALDRDERRVVVAGHTVPNSAFGAAIIDRVSGAILHALQPRTPAQRGTVWASAFSPSGKRVLLGTETGEVWLWTPGAKTDDLVLVGQHNVDRVKDPWHKFVRLVAFDPADPTEATAISVCCTGETVRWGPKGQPQVVHRFSDPINKSPVAISRDGKWVAAIPQPSAGKKWYTVEVAPVRGGPGVRTFIPPDLWVPGSQDYWQEVPHRVAFSPSGRYLAVSLRRIGRTGMGSNVTFFQERSGGRVIVYDLTNPDDNQVSKPGPRQEFYAGELAFDPTNEDRLAIADGDNHNVVLWDWKANRELGRVDQPGRSLWGVAISKDGRQIAFQNERNPAPVHPNERGAGPWRYFDLKTRQYLADAPFEPQQPRRELNGWKVVTTEDGQAAQKWSVERNGTPYPLPWFDTRDEYPRCYTFVPGADGRPDRLVVGHYWGASVYELTPKGPVKTRVLRGHEGYVTSVAVDGSGKRLVTASRDMTLAGWSLDDWRLGDVALHPRLGAELSVVNGRLVVGKIAAGSPVWEMGLDEGDVIVGVRTGFLVGNEVKENRVYIGRPMTHAGTPLAPKGSPDAALAYLNDSRGTFAPNNTHYFFWVKPNAPGTVYVGLTTLIDRPLWRFFPHGDREWVLWRFRDYYYDCSTRGDYSIGWQRSYRLDQLRKPDFYRAEQFSDTFLDPKRLAATLDGWQTDDALQKFNTIEPPKITVAPPEKVAGGYRVTVAATAQGDRPNQQPRRVLVWLNDCLVADLSGDALAVKDRTARVTVTVPAALLRSGDNRVTAQCYGVGGARADADPVAVAGADRPGKPILHALLIGVSDYGRSKVLKSINAADDARALARALEGQAGKEPFAEVRVGTVLDRAVTREAVLDALDCLRESVRPDDLLVVYLGGHGTSRAEMAKVVDRSKLAGLGRFQFLCGDFSFDRMRDTSIQFEELHDRFARLACHKLLLLDACHSGEAETAAGKTSDNPVRVLTEHGIGPVILAACQPDEQAIESPGVDLLSGAYGLFSIGLTQLLEDADAFRNADRDRNGRLEAAELAKGIDARMRAVVDRHNELRRDRKLPAERQTPAHIVPRLEERVPVAGR